MGDLGDDSRESKHFRDGRRYVEELGVTLVYEGKRAATIAAGGYCPVDSTRIGTRSRGVHRDERGLRPDLPRRSSAASRGGRVGAIVTGNVAGKSSVEVMEIGRRG
jgi:hypothetical protein